MANPGVEARHPGVHIDRMFSDPKSEVMGWRHAWLSFRVHVDAFRFAPFAYLQGVGWCLRRLRVRSRNRLAALKGRSPLAYALWIELHEPVGQAMHGSPAGGDLVSIWPVIDCRQDSFCLEGTLTSLALAGGANDPILIGGECRPGLRRIEHPRDLAPLIGEHQPWLLPLRAGDRLAGNSISIYAVTAAQARSSWLVYADDDIIDVDGGRGHPHFKPDWNPELFQHHDFITGANIVRVNKEDLANLPDAGWTRALVDQALKRGCMPAHVKLVLHHRPSRPEPLVPAKPTDFGSDQRPSITAIIPTRNKYGLLRTCIEGLKKTQYAHIQTIIIDNGSDDRETLDYLQNLQAEGLTVLRLPGPFNYSALNNAAAKHARGDLLGFLNNDVEMRDPDWLSLLVRHAVKDDIGAVGARLLYPDGTIQHAGIFTGIGGGAGHAHRFLTANDPGYFHRARLPQRVSAVTGACMVVAREKFEAVGGFDEQRFPVAFNDVDLCLKLNARGWQSFYEPRATLIHHESKSRGSDRLRVNRERFAGELAALKEVWKTDTFTDPYHHPHLSPFCEQFLIAV